MQITSLTTDHLRIPLRKPGRVSLTAPKSNGPETVDLILVHLQTDDGLKGLGFTYLLGSGAATIRSFIDTELSQLVIGEDPHDTDGLFSKAESRFRPMGFSGLIARAYAAIDIALWDLKAKAAKLPLYKLWGSAKQAAPFFVSDIAVEGRDAAEVVKLGKPLLKQGATGVRVEIGRGDVQEDADRVREMSEGLGEDSWVGVAADGRFDLGTAQALAHFFEDIGVDWFEDPIPASDEPGYAKLAGLMETPLTVGCGFASREAFFRVIRAGHVRTVRPDVCRLGGITPILKIAAVAEAYHVAVSTVRLPEVGVHLACGLGVVPHVDSVPWFREVFKGGPTIEDGKIVPSAEPGLGLDVANPKTDLV
ncbi:MAG TPA: mandelate racemase/muconate lactonizing enzyme family protein [Gemmata sp.]|nr:mandelate racemase/muconate lactonizing enzyme family protein [Gemmata sp.]